MTANIEQFTSEATAGNMKLLVKFSKYSKYSSDVALMFSSLSWSLSVDCLLLSLAMTMVKEMLNLDMATGCMALTEGMERIVATRLNITGGDGLLSRES